MAKFWKTYLQLIQEVFPPPLFWSKTLKTKAVKRLFRCCGAGQWQRKNLTSCGFTVYTAHYAIQLLFLFVFLLPFESLKSEISWEIVSQMHNFCLRVRLTTHGPEREVNIKMWVSAVSASRCLLKWFRFLSLFLVQKLMLSGYGSS